MKILKKKKKKKNCLPILGIHNSTRALQSSQILRKNGWKSQKIYFSSKIWKCKKYFSFVIFFMRLVFNQSSPKQPVSDFCRFVTAEQLNSSSVIPPGTSQVQLYDRLSCMTNTVVWQAQLHQRHSSIIDIVASRYLQLKAAELGCGQSFV